MMAAIKYKIKFYSDWHCGSGLAGGADIDALVIKDENGFPYIPGKTIKGLIREAVETLATLATNQTIPNAQGKIIKEAFGYFSGEKESMTKGSMFFSNACMGADLVNAISNEGLTGFLYRTVVSTAIDDDGIAKDHSLRRCEVVAPCELSGSIYDVPDNMEDSVRQALKYIKRLGLKRNRGFGRCDFYLIEIEKEEEEVK